MGSVETPRADGSDSPAILELTEDDEKKEDRSRSSRSSRGSGAADDRRTSKGKKPDRGSFVYTRKQTDLHALEDGAWVASGSGGRHASLAASKSTSPKVSKTSRSIGGRPPPPRGARFGKSVLPPGAGAGFLAMYVYFAYLTFVWIIALYFFVGRGVKLKPTPTRLSKSETREAEAEMAIERKPMKVGGLPPPSWWWWFVATSLIDNFLFWLHFFVVI